METLPMLLPLLSIGILITIGILFVWEAVWKLLGLWRSAQNNHLGWFLCIAIFNTLGILPIIYLLTHKNEKNNRSE